MLHCNGSNGCGGIVTVSHTPFVSSHSYPSGHTGPSFGSNSGIHFFRLG